MLLYIQITQLLNAFWAFSLFLLSEIKKIGKDSSVLI